MRPAAARCNATISLDTCRAEEFGAVLMLIRAAAAWPGPPVPNRVQGGTKANGDGEDGGAKQRAVH